MVEVFSDKDVLATLHEYQKTGHLCDVIILSSEGGEFVAHAGVLAAASPQLAGELRNCERGNYIIEMALNSEETEAFIHIAYTGQRRDLEYGDLANVDCLFDVSGAVSHEQLVMSRLEEFAEKGLFCNMAWYGTPGETKPSHSYVIAAKFDFMSDEIETGSIVSLRGSVPPPNSGSNLQNHPPSDDKFKYRCTDCRKGFNYLTTMASHRCILKSVNSFPCTTCRKLFKTKSRLRQHELSHSLVRPFACDHCRSYFQTVSSLNRHVRSRHGDLTPQQTPGVDPMLF